MRKHLFALLAIAVAYGCPAEAACTWKFKSKLRVLVGQDPLVTLIDNGVELDCAYKLNGPGADGRQLNQCHAGNRIYLLERDPGGGVRNPTCRLL